MEFIDSLFNSMNGTNTVLICLLIVGITLVVSFIFNFALSFKLRATKSFYMTSLLTPVIVATIISLVSVFLTDSTSTGAVRIATIAVALGLVRFRSANGRAEELLILFAGVGLGLVAGLGYIVFAIIFAVVFDAIYILISNSKLFEGKKFQGEKLLKVTIPESLEYDEIFNDTFAHYLKKNELIEVKTTGMGSLFRLSYRVELKNDKEQKEFIDELRTRNGNLEISMLPYTGENKLL